MLKFICRWFVARGSRSFCIFLRNFQYTKCGTIWLWSKEAAWAPSGRDGGMTSVACCSLNDIMSKKRRAILVRCTQDMPNALPHPWRSALSKNALFSGGLVKASIKKPRPSPYILMSVEFSTFFLIGRDSSGKTVLAPIVDISPVSCIERKDGFRLG